jgi:hypothetical protein
MASLVFVFSGVLFLCHFHANAQQLTPQKEQAGDSVQSEVIEKEKLAWELTKKKDRSNLADLLSEDFTEITDDGIMDREPEC